jgi:hypothetical protein
LFIVRRIPIKAPSYNPQAIASILSYAKKLVHNMNLPAPLANWICSSITVVPTKAEIVGRVLRGTHAKRGQRKTETLLRKLPGKKVYVGEEEVGVSLSRCSNLVKKSFATGKSVA